LSWTKPCGGGLATGIKGEGNRKSIVEGCVVRDAVIRYAEKRLNKKGGAAYRVALAIAKKHRRESMPTQNSFQYSKPVSGYLPMLMLIRRMKRSMDTFWKQA
jgi:hypothetical protein